MGIYPTIYQGLRAGWLSVDDLGPLPAYRCGYAWPVRASCTPSPQRRADVAVHEFATDGTDTLYRLCDPDGPAPEV